MSEPRVPEVATGGAALEVAEAAPDRVAVPEVVPAPAPAVLSVAGRVESLLRVKLKNVSSWLWQ